MTEQPVASFYHAETTDINHCREIAESVEAVISGVEVGCFLSQNGRQVVFTCTHPNTLTRSSALVLVKQFLRKDLDTRPKFDYGDLRVIVLANEKGGVAKTTSCVNLATCLAMRGRRVLVIDLDSQANATLGLGQTVAPRSAHPERLLSDPMFPLHRAIVGTDVADLDLIPAGPSLQDANHSLASAVGRELKMRTKLSQHLEMAGITSYDYVMIDSPPAADLLTLNALMAATHLIIPVQASYYSMSALSRLSGTLDSLYDALDPCIQLLGILVTMYDSGRAVQRAVVEVLREKIEREFGDFVFDSAIGSCGAMNESEAYEQPLVLTHPDSSAAEAYRMVAEEILDRLEEGRAVESGTDTESAGI